MTNPTELPPTPDDDDDLVSLACACPSCGERQVDRLTWLDDDWVRCETCGRLYKP